MPYKITSSDHSYILGIETNHAKVGFNYLSSFIIFKGQCIDKIILTTVNDDELNLNGGRFKHFINQPQEHKVQLVFDSNLELLQFTGAEIFNFIGNSINSKWHLTVWCTDLSMNGKTIFDFSFEDKNEAILVKMSVG